MGLFACGDAMWGRSVSDRMVWIFVEGVDGDSIALLGSGTDGYGILASSGVCGTECFAGLWIVSGAQGDGSGDQ
jgi:hypothetical protein